MQKFTWFSLLDWRQISLAGILGLASFGFGYLILKFLRSKLSKKSAVTSRVTLPSNVYETDKLVNQYMAFHYAEEEKYFKYDFGPKDHLEFPSRCAKLCMEHMTVRNRCYPVFVKKTMIMFTIFLLNCQCCMFP